MTDNELDQLLNRWRAPAASSGLRERVLERFPQCERRSFWRPLRWALPIAAALCMIALGTAQSGHPLENLANGVQGLIAGVHQFVGSHWAAHVLSAVRNSHPKVYVDGQLLSETEYGGRGATMWVQVPGEGKYVIALHSALMGGLALPAGRFRGRDLEFHAGGRVVRMEWGPTLGFGVERPVYVWDIAAIRRR
jgi:hypothetical protein